MHTIPPYVNNMGHIVAVEFIKHRTKYLQELADMSPWHIRTRYMIKYDTLLEEQLISEKNTMTTTPTPPLETNPEATKNWPQILKAKYSENKCIYNYPQSFCSCNLKVPTGGDNCSIVYCLNDCSKNGICDYQTGLCKCNASFTGIDCSVIIVTME